MIESWLVLAGLSRPALARLVRLLATTQPPVGRPCAHPLEARVLIACIALRTDLTLRELAAIARTSKSTVADAARDVDAAREPGHDRRRDAMHDDSLG